MIMAGIMMLCAAVAMRLVTPDRPDIVKGPDLP